MAMQGVTCSHYFRLFDQLMMTWTPSTSSCLARAALFEVTFGEVVTLDQVASGVSESSGLS